MEAAIFKGLGVVAGLPDIIAIKGGQTYGLELKAPKGAALRNQRMVTPQRRAFASVTYVLHYWKTFCAKSRSAGRHTSHS